MGAELTKTGYVKRTPQQIRDELVAKIREKVPEFTLKPADLQSNLINTAIEDLIQYEDETATMLNSISPFYANDMIIKKFAESIGLRTNKKFDSSVVLTFSGEPGTFIPKGTSCSGSGYSFETEEDIILSSTGSKNILAYSEDVVAIPANVINTIDNLNIEGLSVRNEVDGIRGVEQESIEQLKYRMQARFRSPRKGGVDYTYSVLTTNLQVDPRLIRFRVVPNENAFNRAIECIVGGGNDEDVALALFQGFIETQKLISMPSNNETNRTINVNVKYYGNTIPIQFTRPKNLNLSIRLILAFNTLAATPTSIKGILEQELTQHINSMKLGEPVSKISLQAFILPRLEAAGIPSSSLAKIDFILVVNGNSVTYYSGSESDPELRKLRGQVREVTHDTYLTLTNFDVVVEA